MKLCGHLKEARGQVAEILLRPIITLRWQLMEEMRNILCHCLCLCHGKKDFYQRYLLGVLLEVRFGVIVIIGLESMYDVINLFWFSLIRLI